MASQDLAKLRAGYSANAEIIIMQAKDILVIPERLVEFFGDSAYVWVQDSVGKKDKRTIETGLSDGITTEVAKGLNEGDMVAEKPAKESSED